MALFPIYPLPVSSAEVFRDSMERARKLRMEESKTAEDIEASKSARAIEEKKLPLTMETLQANIDKIRDDISMSPLEKKLKMAQIGEILQKTQLMPKQLEIESENARSKSMMSKYYNAPSLALIRSLNAPEMQSLISSNPEVAKNVAQGLMSIAGRAGGDIASATMSEDGIDTITDSLVNTGKLPTSDPLVQKSILSGISSGSITEKDIKGLQQNTADALSKKTSTAQMMNQRQYANVLNSLFESGDPLIPSVAKYAGAAGKGKKSLDAVKSSLGETSDDYANYLYFTRNVAPNLANEMRRTLGGQATDYEGKVMADIANPAYWDSNPDTAQKQWNFLRDMYKRKIDPALMARPSDILAEFRMGEENTSNNNIEDTKVKNGVTYIKKNGKWYTE